jgi:hypothetical protein
MYRYGNGRGAVTVANIRVPYRALSRSRRCQSDASISFVRSCTKPPDLESCFLVRYYALIQMPIHDYDRIPRSFQTEPEPCVTVSACHIRGHHANPAPRSLGTRVVDAGKGVRRGLSLAFTIRLLRLPSQFLLLRLERQLRKRVRRPSVCCLPPSSAPSLTPWGPLKEEEKKKKKTRAVAA